MIPVFDAAFEVQAFCEQQEWRFCFIGGLAVQRWGEQRATDDVDLTLLTGFGGEEVFVDAFLARFRARDERGREMALRRRVLLLVNANGVNLDVALGAIPFEVSSVERSSLWPVTEGSLRTCSAEDLLVHKCFANRTRDWTDVEGILIRQWGRLDALLDRLAKSPGLPAWHGL